MYKNILGLFDGMSCGQIALQKTGIKYQNYFASEIPTILNFELGDVFTK
jgi:hypothetical protein